jgi:hypothetical protein
LPTAPLDGSHGSNHHHNHHHHHHHHHHTEGQTQNVCHVQYVYV